MHSTIFLNCSFPFDKLSALMKAELAGSQITDSTSITDIQVAGKDTWLEVVTHVRGSYSGTLIAKFKPLYDRDKRTFELDQLNIRIGEKNLLARGANWVMQKFFGDEIEQKFARAINQKYQQVFDLVLREYTSASLANGLTANADIATVDFEYIHCTDAQLCCTVIIEAEIHVSLK